MPFTNETLAFLARLRRNNRKEWFEPREEQYRSLVRTPMIELVTALNAKLARFAPDYVTEPERAVYRIYRDLRFSADKTPYKTEVSALLWHRKLGKNGGPGFYVALSPQQLMVAAGVYLPPPPQTLLLRRHIAARFERLDEILSARALQARFESMAEGGLARPPKGFDPRHPAIELLKQRSWILGEVAAPESALEPRFLARLARGFELLTPFVDFLAEPFLRRPAKRDPLEVKW